MLHKGVDKFVRVGGWDARVTYKYCAKHMDFLLHNNSCMQKFGYFK